MIFFTAFVYSHQFIKRLAEWHVEEQSKVPYKRLDMLRSLYQVKSSNPCLTFWRIKRKIQKIFSRERLTLNATTSNLRIPADLYVRLSIAAFCVTFNLRKRNNSQWTLKNPSQQIHFRSH